MSNWEITRGVITKSDLKPTGSVPADNTAFIPNIEYQYFVLGVEYKGMSVTLPSDVIYDMQVAKGLLDEYPVGKQVNVFYHPEDHRVAVLEKEPPYAPSWMSWFLIITAFSFLLFGFAFLLRLFQ